MDFGGKVLAEEKQYISIDPLASKVYLDWPLKKLTDAGGADTARVFVVADLQIGGATDYAMNGKEISRSIIYLTPVKQIQLKPATLRVETTGEKGNYKVSISSPVLARDVYLSFGNLDVRSRIITSTCCPVKHPRLRPPARRPSPISSCR
jgi:beta-mannosidase